MRARRKSGRGDGAMSDEMRDPDDTGSAYTAGASAPPAPPSGNVADDREVGIGSFVPVPPNEEGVGGGFDSLDSLNGFTALEPGGATGTSGSRASRATRTPSGAPSTHAPAPAAPTPLLADDGRV